MDFITSTILSGVLYDGLKAGAVMSVDHLKHSLQKWFIDDAAAQLILRKTTDLEINRDMSESAIQARIDSDSEFIEQLKNIPLMPQVINNISTHNGTGDIVNGNKIVYNK